MRRAQGVSGNTQNSGNTKNIEILLLEYLSRGVVRPLGTRGKAIIKLSHSPPPAYIVLLSRSPLHVDACQSC